MQQHLQVSNGEANLAAQKCQRYYDMQEKAQGYALVSAMVGIVCMYYGICYFEGSLYCVGDVYYGILSGIGVL